MKEVKKKILVIATSSKTRGGITSVINSYKNKGFWENWNCIWIETHIDKVLFFKIVYFFTAMIVFLRHVRSSSLVHIHLSAPVSVKRKLFFIRITRLFKKPIILHFHAFSEKSNINKAYINLYKKTFSLADKIIVLSKSWRKGLIDDLNIPPDKIQVIYNPCPQIDSSINVQKQNIILFAGTLNERKNFKTLIRAFALIAKKTPNWNLVFAGNGAIDEGIELAKELGIDKQVNFKGWVAGKSKHELFSTSSIFCLPSYAEGFPMAVLDAWAYGLPVITTPVGGIPEIAIDGENMILFEPDDLVVLSQKLFQLIKDENYRDKLKMASFDLAKFKFSSDNITQQLDDLYSSLL